MAAVNTAESDNIENESHPIRVLLVDDHPFLRRALAEFLEEEPDLDVVGEAASGPEALHLAGQLRPDVVLMDVNLPGMNGIEATRHIRARQPRTSVVGLSMHADAPMVEAMRDAGAALYVTKDAPTDTLLRAIRCAHA